jgi:hypothetical protein
MLNRSAIILRYKEPALQWINEFDPPHEEAGKVKLEDTWEDANVYLISNADGYNKLTAVGWVESNYDLLFETELEGWYTDPDMWPKKRTYKMFQEWFDVEYHSVLIDTVGTPMWDDEIEQIEEDDLYQ